ncbi:MAG: TonB-dependent receptor [Deltaproteobacteria bacterium]|nr:TonB-dependent receptor [Deltaproteobacteria bacterium]MBW2393790.1 TonB-dependent receptor [Deltaproteobacteria bacterium]
MRGSKRLWMGWGAVLLVVFVARNVQAEEPIAAPAEVVGETAEPQADPAQLVAPIIEVKAIRVEGRRLLKPRFQGSDARTVIGREEIEAKKPQALVELLRQQAGVVVTSNGGPGKLTSVSIRGSNSNQVRVLVDGVLVGSSTTGQYNWANLSSLDVDHIEVLRGPQTTIYGASAMGGVIQIFTREPEPGLSASASGGYGNRGHRTGAVRVSGGTESGVRASFAMEHTTINGVSSFRPDPSKNSHLEVDPFRNTTTSAQISAPVGAGRVRFSWRRADAQAELDSFLADNESFDQDTRQRNMSIDWQHPVTDNWATRLLLGQHDDRIVGEDPNFSFNNYDIESKRRQVSWTNDVEWGDFSFLGGVDLEHERAVNDSAAIRESTRRTGIFGQLRYDVERVGASMSVRREWNNRSDDKWTYQLGGRVTLLEGLDLLANFGTAFRAPTLNELFFTDAFSAGNPDLTPETSHGGDLGLRWTGACECGFQWKADIRAFHQSFENLIEYRDQGGFFFVPENVERARMSGAEVELRFDWKALWVSTSYTRLRTRDADGFTLARRPRNQGRLSIGGEWWDRFRAEVVLHAVGRTFSSAQMRRPVKSYWTADAHLSVEITQYLTARLAVRNFTNHGYEEVDNFGTLPRMAFVSLEASF